MDVLDMLDKEETLDSVIQLQGNFFIMDSEQLVSKPFRELQVEAMNDAHKKSSMTDKLTTVKNNICENHYILAKERLDRQKTRRLKQLHDNSNKLRQEVKLFNLDRQRHHVEVKKRLQPERDYSYDDTLVQNMERRLGANLSTGYLDKKLKYPIRLRSINDIKVTPAIKKARACLQQHAIQRSIETTLRASPMRSQTARSAATSLTSAIYQRRNSRSAPFISRYSDQQTNLLPAVPLQHSLTSQGQQRPQTRVKFSFQSPPGDLQSSKTVLMSNRPHSEFTLPKSIQLPDVTDDEENNEDDDPNLPDYIDLNAHFQGNVVTSRCINSQTSAAPPNSAPQSSVRRGSPPRLTTDVLQVEMDQINSKINTFMKVLSELQNGRHRNDDDSDDGFMDSIKHIFPKSPLHSNRKTDRRMSISLKQPNHSQVKARATSPPGMRDGLPQPSEATDVSLKDREEMTDSARPTRTPKYSWKCIRAHVLGPEKNERSTEELVLEALTGVPISNSMHTHVPLHTASRALRHTATYKMHKVVEKLIQERTKYERVQVEELKKQMIAEDGCPAEGQVTTENVIDDEVKN